MTWKVVKDGVVGKVCTLCGNWYPLDNFPVCRNSPGGRLNRCKPCFVPKKALSDKDYRDRNSGQLNVYKRKYNRDPKNKERRNSYTRSRREQDPLFREVLNSRSMVAKAVKRNTFSDCSKTAEYLCCTFSEFMAHMGPMFDGAQVDHIVPLNQAKTVEEVKKLWHFSNLAWSSCRHNHNKFDGWTEEAGELCKVLLGRDWDMARTFHVDTKYGGLVKPEEKENNKDE
jgi:hypothetical protein